METFKYQLSKKGKVICPRCGKKRFVQYVDITTSEPIAPEVGKCDRADSCQYHYTPKEYFKDNGVTPNTLIVTTRKSEPIVKADFIPEEYQDLTLNGYEHNTLIRALTRAFGEEQTMRVVRVYGVGTYGDSTVFWQRDNDDHLRTGCVMRYQSNGHRSKEPFANNWIHSILMKKGKLPSNFNMKQCLFGEHLIKLHYNAHIGIVESAKTALICTIKQLKYGFTPMIFVATNGCGNFNRKMLECLRGRDVMIFPDKGEAFKVWKEKAEEMRLMFRTMVIHEELENSQLLKDGSDIGDVYF